MPVSGGNPEAGIQTVRDPDCPVHGAAADMPTERLRSLIRANEDQIRRFEAGELKAGGKNLDADGTATAEEVRRLKEKNARLERYIAERAGRAAP
jgi:hypothetical protein